jgi:DNA-binding Lrp family transcriptional regulator
MITAIVLIRAERERIPETAEAVARLPHVGEVYSVTGDWDIVALVHLPHYEALAEVVTMGLRRIAGIASTQTMMAFQSYAKEQLDQGFALGLDEGGTGV